MSNKKSYLGISLIIALSLILGACQPAAAPAAEQSAVEQSPKKEVIKFADVMWQTLWINNAIAMYITENGYGYPVESIEMTTPVYQQAILEGDVDVLMENWTGNIQDWWDEVTTNGAVLNLGNTFDQSTQGWYVPRYVIEGDKERGLEPLAPDLKSVYDLPQYKSVFADPENPEKGLIINGIIGWDVSNVNRVKLYAYGLEEDYNFMEPGASAALDAAIAGAYKKGKPILAYYWEPTWLMGLYDMVQLEEPPYTDECWALNKAAKEGDIALEDVSADAGCAFETVGIPKSAAASLQERAPEIVEFLAKMNISTDALNKASAYMETEGVSAEETAIWFFENYPGTWKSWVSADAALNIEAALSKE